MKRKRSGNFIIFILILLIIIILSATIYFCLDVFGLITVPAKYSIASLFYSQIEIIATQGQVLEEPIIPEKPIKEVIYKIEDNEENTQINDEIQEYQNVENPLEKLQELQSQYEDENQSTDNNFVDANVNQNINCEFFYYEQLDDYGKIIYDKLYKNMDKLRTGTYTVDYETTFDELLHKENGSEILNNSFQLAINALTFDHPELFYIDITKINLITEITTRAFSTTYRIMIGGNGRNYLSEDFNSIEKVNTAINDIEIMKNNIKGLTGQDTIENLKIIHDYLVDSIEYDLNAGQNIYNIYGALINKKSVCEGYAKAYKNILDDMQIPCIIACGKGKNSTGDMENHAWNYVQVNGTWYAIDVTWDDPVIIGNGTITNDIKYHYFLKGSDEFFKDHFEDGKIIGDYEFKYPQLSKSNY